MSASRCATFVCLLLIVGRFAAGAEGDLSPLGSGAPDLDLTGSAGDLVSLSGAEEAACVPTAHPKLSTPVRARLHQAFPIAQGRLRNHPSCQALFQRLGADGLAKLGDTTYYPATRKQERHYCRRGALAITAVAGSAVFLCRRFSRVSEQQAAIILIHEALHFAGQTEYPADPDAPDAVGITRMVMRGCWLA